MISQKLQEIQRLALEVKQDSLRLAAETNKSTVRRYFQNLSEIFENYHFEDRFADEIERAKFYEKLD